LRRPAAARRRSLPRALLVAQGPAPPPGPRRGPGHRMSARTVAYRLLVESGVLHVVDVETCPSDHGDRVVSIAIDTWRNGRHRATWSTLVNPGVPITNTHIHRLTDADVANARPFAAIRDEFESYLRDNDAYLVAHHAAFDVGVLHHEYALVADGRQLPDVPVL